MHGVNPEIPAALASALEERYTLRSLLGRGGMATVYEAWDRKHQRTIAIKVLQPELAASIGAERFLTEIQIVAQLSHPHILPLYDSGETGGFVYYVMPNVSGGSLRHLLENSRSLTIPEAVRIATSVADALSYAHGMGVLHRDIKPENILFSHGHPIVADFGIAKAVSAASAPHLTRTGLSLGTPGYMSQEQAAGFAALDARTDVYSLAVVVYEMIVGEIPGRWPSEDARRVGRFIDVPPAHRTKLGAAGATIEAALVHAMSVQQEQRTPTPGALVAELTGTAPEKRKYAPDEVAAIVKRASELEASNPTGAMTIGAVEAIGAEVGIAPEFMRAAAGSVASSPGHVLSPLPPPKAHPLAGAPTRVYYERVIDGELAVADYQVVVDEIRRVMGLTGIVNQLGTSFTWTAGMQRRREVEISVSARGGATRIAYSENLATLVGATFGGICGGAGGGGMGLVAGFVAGAMHMPQLLPVAIPVWLGGIYFAARGVYRQTVTRRETQGRDAVDRICELVSALTRGQPRLPGR